MKTNLKICAVKCEYLHPDMEFADVVIEHGFIGSTEIVDKDEEVEF